MGAIVLDVNKVNSYVLSNLTKVNTTMQEAYSTSVTLKNSLPSSFNYRSTINEITNQIYNIKKEISNVNAMITKKVEAAKRIEQKSSSKTSSIASFAAKIGTVTGAVKGAAIGATTGGVAGAVVGAVVGGTAGNTIGRAMANTGAKVVNGAVKIAKGIGDGIKWLGNAIWNGCKKVANAIASFVKEAVNGLVKAAKAVWEGLKWVGKQIVRVGATIVNFVVSLVEGIVSFVEAIGDFVLIVIGGVCSIFTFFADLITGIATGEWDWKATSAVWKKWIMPWVGYDWTSKAFDGVYSWAPFKAIDNAAYQPFKRGEAGYKVGKGVGYVVGIVILTIVTYGAGSAVGVIGSSGGTAAGAAGAATSGVSAILATTEATVISTALAGAGKMGQSAQNSYNATIDSKVKDHYVSELMKTNNGLTIEEATKIVEENLKNGVYSDEKQVRKNAMDNISGGEIGKVIGSSAIKGAVEAGTWYLTYGGGMKGNWGTATNGAKIYKGGGALGEKAATYFANNAKMLTATKAGIQAGKEYFNAGADAIVTGEYNFAEATQSAIVSAGTSVLYDTTVAKGLKSLSTKTGTALEEELKKGQVVEISDDIMDDVTDDVVVESVGGKVKKFALNTADKTLKFATANAGGKKIVGKAIKSPISNTLEKVVDA